ncbi:MAG: hypothetical protein Q8L98_05420 [Chlamydiales bacterium]|nr:hypothetical protein [Chlamydiales bacterium]
MEGLLQKLQLPSHLILSKKWKVVSLSLILFFAAWLSPSAKQPSLPPSFVGEDISAILAAMPKADKDALNYFFQELIQNDCFGYVLLGEKPLALSTISLTVNPFACLWESLPDKEYVPLLHERFLVYLQEVFSPSRIKLKKGYEIWRKYEKPFKSQKFSFLYEISETAVHKNVHIYLVNKKNFIKTANENKKDFEFVLNKKISECDLLREAKKRPLFEILQRHHGLFGILLGYGRNNALSFQKMSLLSSEEQVSRFCEKIGFYNFWTEEETKEFCHRMHASADWIPLPNFRAISTSKETQLLRRSYLKSREDILNCYRDRDFLKTTLELLTASEKLHSL